MIASLVDTLHARFSHLVSLISYRAFNSGVAGVDSMLADVRTDRGSLIGVLDETTSAIEGLVPLAADSSAGRSALETILELLGEVKNRIDALMKMLRSTVEASSRDLDDGSSASEHLADGQGMLQSVRSSLESIVESVASMLSSVQSVIDGLDDRIEHSDGKRPGVSSS